MANITVSTDSNYSSIGHTDDNQITVTTGAVLTINTDTARIEDLICITLGTISVENNSTTTPIFVDIGDEANSALRVEKGGVFETHGAWIPLGVSNGSADQSFTLPTNLAGDKYKQLGGLEVVSPTGDILLYNRVDDLTGKRTNEIYGLHFEHDVAAGTITFGDISNGYIPPDGYTIRVPNIQIQDSSTGSYYCGFDVSIGGTIKTNITSFSENFKYDLRNASKIEFRHTSATAPVSDIYLVTTSNLVFESFIFETDYALGIRATACNNINIDGLSIYMTTTSTNHSIQFTSCNDGVVKNMINHRPNSFYGHYRGGFSLIGNGFTLEDCHVTCSVNGYAITGSNNTFKRCFINNAQSPSSNNGIYYGFYLQGGANYLFEDCGSYPMNYADGGVPPRNSFYTCTTACQNITITGGQIYAGAASGEKGQLSVVVDASCPGVRVNDIDVYGEIQRGLVDINYSGKDCETSNIRTHGVSYSTEQYDWASGSKADLVTMPRDTSVLSNDPDDVGSDCASFLSYNKGTQSVGWLTRVMSEDISLNLFEEVVKTGVIAFDNSSYMYIQNAGDIITSETHVHHGIVSFTSALLNPSSSSSYYQIEFAMRNPGGSYGGFLSYTAGNMNTALGLLDGYDPSNGLQIKFKITKLITELTRAVEKLYMEVGIDPLVRAPFEIVPTYFTVKNLIAGDAVYLQNETNVEKYFGVSDGSDIAVLLPNANAGEHWKYVINRPGFNHQSGEFEVVVGGDINIIQGMTEKLQAIGGSMYTASDVSSVSIDFDFSTPQLSIDITQTETAAQNVFDKTERALITEDGMKWLAIYGTDIEYQNLGGAGSFLFNEGNIRVRRQAIENTNASINAYVSSTDGIAVDESNGTVGLYSGTLSKDILETDLDDYDDIDGSVGQALSIILALSSGGSGGGGSITAEDIYTYFAETNRPDIFKADVSDLALASQITALNDFNPSTDPVALVTLVETTTTNTDMRGTDGANTVTPDNVTLTQMQAVVPTVAQITADIDNNSTKLDTILQSADLAGALSA